ncbi:MAG: hypothetical protein M3321_09595 [Actinomycetota bacterium]|nr:hypothetical protein [Actinomycetota bacterium]
MTTSSIVALAVNAYGAWLVYAFRYELVGAVFHWLRMCECPGWNRCENAKRR